MTSGEPPAGAPPRRRPRSAMASASRPVRVRRVASIMSGWTWFTVGASSAQKGGAGCGGACRGRSTRPVGKGGLDRRAGVERAQDLDRADRGAGELGRDVAGDAGEAEHADVERLAAGDRRLEVVAAVVAQAEVEALPGRGTPGHVGVTLELVADGGADQVGAVRVEAFLDQQVDPAEVDVAEVDRDLLAVGRLRPQLLDVAGHLWIIPLPSVWMVKWDRPRAFQAAPAQRCTLWQAAGQVTRPRRRRAGSGAALRAGRRRTRGDPASSPASRPGTPRAGGSSRTATR